MGRSPARSRRAAALDARLITLGKKDVDAETAPPFGGAVAVEALSPDSVGTR